MRTKTTLRNIGMVVVLALATGLHAADAPGSKAGVGAASDALRVPAGFRLAAKSREEPYTKTEWAQEIVHEQSGISMVYVPAGSFLMGSPPTETNRNRDEIQHEVVLPRGFYLGKYEVTQQQWQSLMGSTVQQQWEKSGKSDPLLGTGKDMPMYYVSWNDARDLCAKLGAGFRLPTEAEWEYACRAGTTTPHAGPIGKLSWTADNSGRSLLDPKKVDQQMAKSKNPSRKGFVELLRKNACGPHPVGTKQSNAWGLHDMHGNVWEWCQDGYAPFGGTKTTDPTGPPAGPNVLCRVSRGGSWFDFAEFLCRSACRDCGDPPSGKRTADWRGFTHGVRLAFSLDAATKEGEKP